MAATRKVLNSLLHLKKQQQLWLVDYDSFEICNRFKKFPFRVSKVFNRLMIDFFEYFDFIFKVIPIAFVLIWTNEINVMLGVA